MMQNGHLSSFKHSKRRKLEASLKSDHTICKCSYTCINVITPALIILVLNSVLYNWPIDLFDNSSHLWMHLEMCPPFSYQYFPMTNQIYSQCFCILFLLLMYLMLTFLSNWLDRNLQRSIDNKTYFKPHNCQLCAHSLNTISTQITQWYRFPTLWIFKKWIGYPSEVYCVLRVLCITLMYWFKV